MKKWLATLFTDKNLHRICVAIIAIGIILRIVFYTQNRCLFIDEANVARNIYERSFLGLTRPLDYEQYAPPIFLWVVKIFTAMLGYHEMAYRLFSMLCGAAVLVLAYKALRRYTSLSATWYPLFIMATGFIYIRYSAELKQYMCDAAVVLSLLLLALRYDVLAISRIKFLLVWALIGSITVWLSMPGVFMLAAVMSYYAFIALSKKDYSLFPLLVGIGLIWLVQFGIYYMVILKPQINSSFLQDCHKDFFLFPIPHNITELHQNIDVLTKLFAAMGGKWAIPIALHVLAFAIGIGYLFKRQRALLVLAITPILCTLAAAAVRQYALTPRLVLFLMPLMLLIISVGFRQMLQVGLLPVKAIVLAAAAITLFNFSTFQLFWQRMDNEEITTSMRFITRRGIDGRDFYVHDLARPAFIYYTTIHPRHDEWIEISTAHFLAWNCNYDSLGRTLPGKFGLLYSWAPEAEIANTEVELKRYNQLVADTIVTGSRAYVYSK